MNKIKYILIIFMGALFFSSCGEGLDPLEGLDDTLTIASFEEHLVGMGGEANGSEYTHKIKVKVNGPGIYDLNTDVTLTIEASENSTAKEGVHYRIENKSITLTKQGSYLGNIDIVLMTQGNTPPMEGTPEFEDYKAPVLYLNIVSVSGGHNTVATGKTSKITLNFTPPNPYAGEYSADIKYFHPTAGGTYPTETFVSEVNDKKLTAVTGRKCETDFAIWGEANKCWITINSDNSISFVVADTWSFDVKLGDPNDPSKVSRFDPNTGIIYLYYHYAGDGGNRIFWETFTPKK